MFSNIRSVNKDSSIGDHLLLNICAVIEFQSGTFLTKFSPQI